MMSDYSENSRCNTPKSKSYSMRSFLVGDSEDIKWE